MHPFSFPFPCAVSRQFLAKRLKCRAFVRDDSSCCSSLSAFFNDFSYLHFRFVSQCADAFSQIEIVTHFGGVLEK